MTGAGEPDRNSWSLEDHSSNSSSEDRLRSRKSSTGNAGVQLPQQHQHGQSSTGTGTGNWSPLHTTGGPVFRRLKDGRLLSRNTSASSPVLSRCLVIMGAVYAQASVTYNALKQGARSSPKRTFVLLWGCRHFRLVILTVLIVLIQIIYNPLSWRRIDNILTFRVMARHFRAQEQALLEAGVALPRTQVDYANVINTHAALREVLIRRQKRARTLQSLERAASAHCDDRTCQTLTTIPKVLFVPSILNWEPPRPGVLASGNFTLIRYDETEMRHLIQDVSLLLHPSKYEAQPLVAIYDRLMQQDKIQLWSICTVFLHGGIFVGNSNHQQPMVDDLLFGNDSFVKRGTRASTAVVVVEGSGTEKQGRFRLLVATPRHGLLGCLLRSLEETNPEGVEGIIWRMFPFLELENATWQHQLAQLPFGFLSQGSWQRWFPRDGLCGTDSCQHGMESTTVAYKTVKAGERIVDNCDIYANLVRLEDTTDQVGESSKRRVSVTIHERTEAATDNANRAKQKKITLQSQMRKAGVEPGWFCNRCLNSAALGTFEKCKRFCPIGYKELMCDTPDTVIKNNIDVDVIVRGFPSTFTAATKAIPRIIHQTWFEAITLDRYPQLARLQASWKYSGWDFRFYTDETARQYIVDNYPYRFVEAFDALIHGAYKADFFRYVVLMREGGIYADVDVKLDGSLDAWISPSMTFFAPRDIPCEYAGEAFCLWNGFIGAAPGNPIIVRAVERLVNLIQDRADIYDMERETCRRSDSGMQVWKVRAQPLLFLSGPCALGVAMNEALHRPPLDSFPIGWIGMSGLEFGGRQDHGDVLVMVADKYDLGEFRISHPESGVIVAATDIDGLDKSPRELGNPSEGDIVRNSLRRKPIPHYSNSNRRVSVWGMANVYNDELVINERIRLNVQFME